jgi:protease I
MLPIVIVGVAATAACDNAGFKADPTPVTPAIQAPTNPNPPAPRVVAVNTTHINQQGKLAGLRVAILATDGFEQSELVEPRQAFANEGASTVVVSPKTGQIQGYLHEQPVDFVQTDLALEDANPADFDALQLPGGVMNSDKLRLLPSAIAFVQSFARSGKPIAAICHGLWTMVDADVVRGRTLTSWPSLKNDLKNAGAKWVDETVVQDRNFVTSRKPEDITAFNAKAIEVFGKYGAGVTKPAIGGGPRE